MPSSDPHHLFSAVRSGDRSALGRALTLVESRLPADRKKASTLVDACMTHAGHTLVVAVTGLPGSGKSTMTDRVGSLLVAEGHRVAVLAVDPSSSRTGGSILGDKTRMERLARLENAFIRPSPTGGALGGVTDTTQASIAVCAAAGFDIVLVETVGVGQSEVSVAEMADRVILVTLSGGGDGLQGIKRGILESCDLVVVNKADGTGVTTAEQTARELHDALHVLRPDDGVPVWPVSALEGKGINDVVAFIRKAAHLSSERSRALRPETVFDRELVHAVQRALRDRPDLHAALSEVRSRVTDGRLGPFEAVQALLDRIRLAPD